VIARNESTDVRAVPGDEELRGLNLLDLPRSRHAIVVLHRQVCRSEELLKSWVDRAALLMEAAGFLAEEVTVEGGRWAYERLYCGPRYDEIPLESSALGVLCSG